MQPYREAVERHGAGFEATLWNSPEAQVLRFDVMIGLMDLEGCAVLDVGCGQGDLAARLLERRVPFARYVGVDALAEMIEAARLRRLDRCEFVCRDAVADPTVLKTGGPDYEFDLGGRGRIMVPFPAGDSAAPGTGARQGEKGFTAPRSPLRI